MKYIALFRGINVGGKKIVKMTDLKNFMEDIGCLNVQSYIQSGNMVFDSDIRAHEIVRQIQTGFPHTFGSDSTVTLRTMEEWAAIVANLPFSEEEVNRARPHSLMWGIYMCICRKMFWIRQRLNS